MWFCARCGTAEKFQPWAGVEGGEQLSGKELNGVKWVVCPRLFLQVSNASSWDGNPEWPRSSADIWRLTAVKSLEGSDKMNFGDSWKGVLS